MKKVKSYKEKIRQPKARYTTTICERKKCQSFMPMANPKYVGLCIAEQTGVWIKPGIRKCLLKLKIESSD